MKLRCYVTCLDYSPAWVDVECPEGVDIQEAIKMAENGELDCSNYIIQHVARVYLVCRHPGAVEWAETQGFDITDIVQHVDNDFIDSLGVGDRVLGILPIDLAARACAKGAEFHNLSIKIPFELRGKELTADQMQQCGAKFEQYKVESV